MLISNNREILDCIKIADPEAIFAPDSNSNQIDIELQKVHNIFKQYHNPRAALAHIKIFLDGIELSPNSDPFTPISTLRWSNCFLRAIKMAYDERTDKFGPKHDEIRVIITV